MEADTTMVMVRHGGYGRYRAALPLSGSNDLALSSVLLRLMQDNLTSCQGLCERGETLKLQEKVHHCLEALTVLQSRLQSEPGGEACINLCDLYDHCTLTLAGFLIDHDSGRFIQVGAMLRVVQEGWEQLLSDSLPANALPEPDCGER